MVVLVYLVSVFLCSLNPIYVFSKLRKFSGIISLNIIGAFLLSLEYIDGRVNYFVIFPEIPDSLFIFFLIFLKIYFAQIR